MSARNESGLAAASWSGGAFRIFDLPVRYGVPIALALIGIIATVDEIVHLNLALGQLYLIPIFLASIYLKPWQIIVLTIGTSLMRENSSDIAWSAGYTSRVFNYWLVQTLLGLFVRQLAVTRRALLQQWAVGEEQGEQLREAENQMRSLIESSPAAILTLDSDGRIDLANRAASVLLGLGPEEIRGKAIRDFLPVLSDVLRTVGEMPYRTATYTRGRKASGESFHACLWFATYPTREGRRLSAILTDASEELRDYQHTSLESLLRSTRVLVGSVSHEIRNVSAAIAMAHANLGKIPLVAQSEDYIAIGTLADALTRISTLELQSAHEAQLQSIDLHDLLDEFRIIVEPAFEAEEATLDIAADGPGAIVLGDRHSLLQVFLNLARNSLRAMSDSPEKRLSIAAARTNGNLVLRFHDTGAGVTDPERLFRPFRSGAESAGLGLFVSRALARSSRGELYHEPTAQGCTMCLQLVRGEDDDSQAAGPEIAAPAAREISA